MLTIRKAQFDVFYDAARTRFAERLCALLREAYPQCVASFVPEELTTFVKEGIVRGQDWGFQSDATLGDYVSLRLQLGPDFDRYPAVRDVLEDQSVPVENRIGVLFHCLSPEEWQAVREQG